MKSMKRALVEALNLKDFYSEHDEIQDQKYEDSMKALEKEMEYEAHHER